MTRRMLVVNGVLVAGIAAGASVASVSLGQPGSRSATAPVRTATVQRGVVQSLVSGTGNLQSPASVNVNFQTGGVLTRVYVHAGARVTAGQKLAEVDPTTAKRAVASSLASLATAKAQLQQTLEGLTAPELQQNRISATQAQQSVRATRQSNSADAATLKAAVDQAKKGLAAAKQSASISSRSSALSVAQARAGVANAKATAEQNAISVQAAADQAQQALADTQATTAQNEIGYQNSVDQANALLLYDQTYNSQSLTALRSDQNSLTNALQSQTAGKLKDAQSIESATASLESALANQKSQAVQSAQSVASAESSLASAQRSLASGLAKDQQALASAKLSLQSTIAANAIKAAPPQAGTVASAEASVQNAQVNVETAHQTLAETTLRSPIAGTVASIGAHTGDSVSGGGAVPSSSSSSSSGSNGGGSSPFIVLADLNGLEINVGFSESDAVKIRVGQPATVSLDALPNRQLAAHVISINPIASVVNNVVTYTVTFALDRTVAGARPGMTATVDVVTAERDNVLNVPSSAVQGAGGAQFVTVVNGKQQTRVSVTAGLQGDTTTEITSGLKAGQEVVLQTAAVSASSAGAGATTGGFRGGGFGGLGGGGFPRGG